MDRSRLQFSFNAQNSPRSSLKNIPIFFFNTAKQMISSESTVQEVSFKWSHDTISSKNSKVRTCFWNCVEKYCRRMTGLNGHTKRFFSKTPPNVRDKHKKFFFQFLRSTTADIITISKTNRSIWRLYCIYFYCVEWFFFLPVRGKNRNFTEWAVV